MNEKQNVQNMNNDAPGEKKMRAAYKLSSELVKERIGKESKEDLELLEQAQKEDVIVVSGSYDHIHLVLQLTEIPHVIISPDDVSNMKFRPDQTVFINCGTYFPQEGLRKIAGFVASGGQLITTDWALKHVIEDAFPNTIQYNQNPTADEVVRIELLDQEDPVLKGFLDEEADPVWWLEGSSYPIKVLDEKVVVLIRSKEIGEKYGDDPVVVKFEYGKGIVYHMISHFYLQRSETRDKKHTQKASSYAKMKGASKKTAEMYEMMEEEMADLDYGTVQSTNTSTEFISRMIINQKKRSQSLNEDEV